MTSRTLIVLAAALVVLALVAVVGQRSDAPQDESNALFLPELETALADVDRVRVVGAGNETLATLERRPESWVVAEKQGYPADIAKIRGALIALAEARIVEQKTANPDYYDRLGVESVESATATGIELIAYVGDDARASVIVGTADAANLQYVRASDAATSYLVDREITVPREAVEWVDPAILDVSSSRIESVTIEHPDGEVVRIAKNDAADANFTVDGVPEGRELSYPGVADVIANTLRDMRLDDVAAAADTELPAEVTRTTFRTFDGLVVTATSFEQDELQWVRFAASAEPRAAGAETASSGDGSGAAADAAAGGSAADSAAGGSAADSAADSTAGSTTESATGNTTEEPGTPEVSVAGAGEDAEDANAGVDARAEAERINARVGGWQYQIPSYLYGQLTRRMDDLLAAEAEAAEAENDAEDEAE